MSASNGTRRLDWILSPEPSLDHRGPGAGFSVGVLALQGDFREHRVALEQLGALTREVRRADQLEGLDGLVIPGGESTTISKLTDADDLAGPITALLRAGGFVYGTCAGPGVEVLATWEDRMVAAREGGVLVTAFHPELTDDTRVHEPFITMIRRREGAAQPRAADQPSRAVAAPANR